MNFNTEFHSDRDKQSVRAIVENVSPCERAKFSWNQFELFIWHQAFFIIVVCLIMGLLLLENC